MKIGVFTPLLSALSLDDVLKKLKSMGIEMVEFGTGNYPGDAHLHLSLLDKPDELKTFKSKVADAGLTISALSSHGNALHPNKEFSSKHRETSKRTILLAEKLGVSTVVDFSGCPGDSLNAKSPNWVTCPWPPDYLDVLKWQWDEVVTPYWQEHGKFAADHGVKVAIEMHPGFVVYNPETMLRLRAIAGPSVGANLDPSHLFWQGIDPIGTDDFTSEFDPFSPQFGEKFAPPNMPISTKDYLGNEVSRVYSDHWGIYDGLNFSSWDVNPPNITGYSPAMMVQCMNDYGPILDTNLSSPTHGQMINDPLYNPAYSDFCYTEPYMPGTTTYLDTPVVPTQAFVGAGYNNPDCAYPDATPAISEVDGDGIGPYVSAAGHTLTITALGNATVANTSTCTTASTGADVAVNNFGYAGPSASVAPFDCKTVTRHYGFGARCTSPSASSTTCNTTSSVTIGGVPAIITSWSDTAITATVPGGLPGLPQVPLCTIQQQAQYGGSQARCGQLVDHGRQRQTIH